MGCRSSNLTVVSSKPGENGQNPAIAAAQFIMVNPGDLEKDLNFLKTNGYTKSAGGTNNGNPPEATDKAGSETKDKDKENNNNNSNPTQDNPFVDFFRKAEPNNNSGNKNDNSDRENNNSVTTVDNNPNPSNESYNTPAPNSPPQSFLRVKNGVVISPFAQFRKPIPNFHVWKFLMRYIEKTVAKHGEDHEWLREAVSESTIKYSELEPLTRRLGSAFTRQGVQPHDTVIFMTSNSMHIYLVLLALWRLNAAVKILFPEDTTTDVLLRRITESKAKFLVCDKSTSKVAHEARKRGLAPFTIFSIGQLELFEAPDIMNMLVEDDGSEFPGDLQDFNSDVNNDVIYIPCTSGATTGVSKNVLHTHKTMVAGLMQGGLFRSSAASAYTMMPMRIYHLSGVLWPLAILIKGKSALMVETISTQVIFEAIRKYQPKILYGFPSFVITLSLKLDESGLSCPSVKSICSSGETISTSGVEKLKIAFPGLSRIDVSFMMAEILCVNSTIPYNEAEPGSDNTPQGPSDSLEGRIGFLNCFSSAKVINPDTGQVLNENQKGEICLRAHSIMKGYENSEGNGGKETINAGWVHTGDCGFYDQTGMFHVIGRLHEIFKCDGEYVSPTKLEQLLMENPDVSACAVIGVPDEEGETVACAVISRKFGSAINATEVVRFIEAAQVEESQHLRGGVIFMDDLPKNKAGKVNKTEVLRMVINLNKMKSLKQR